MRGDLLITRGRDFGIAQVWRSIERHRIVYRCWVLTNDGTPIGAAFEFDVAPVNRDTLRDQIDADPTMFGREVAQFVSGNWQPPVCPACRAALARAIAEDAHRVGWQVAAR